MLHPHVERSMFSVIARGSPSLYMMHSFHRQQLSPPHTRTHTLHGNTRLLAIQACLTCITLGKMVLLKWSSSVGELKSRLYRSSSSSCGTADVPRLSSPNPHIDQHSWTNCLFNISAPPLGGGGQDNTDWRAGRQKLVTISQCTTP